MVPPASCAVYEGAAPDTIAPEGLKQKCESDALLQLKGWVKCSRVTQSAAYAPQGLYVGKPRRNKPLAEQCAAGWPGWSPDEHLLWSATASQACTGETKVGCPVGYYCPAGNRNATGPYTLCWFDLARSLHQGEQISVPLFLAEGIGPSS